MTPEEEIISDHLKWEMDCAFWKRQALESWDEYKSLAEKYAKLEEENKLLESRDVQRLLEILCLRNDAKNVARYSELVRMFNMELADWKCREKQKRWHERNSDLDEYREENKKLKKYHIRWCWAFWILFGSRLVLLIKALM